MVVCQQFQLASVTDWIVDQKKQAFVKLFFSSHTAPSFCEPLFFFLTMCQAHYTHKAKNCIVMALCTVVVLYKDNQMLLPFQEHRHATTTAQLVREKVLVETLHPAAPSTEAWKYR